MYTISVGNAFGHSIYSDLVMQEITEGVNAAFDNIDRIFAEYHQSLLSPENMEAELFGEAPVQQQTQQPTQNKGIVASLGAAIRGLISAFGQMIQKLGEVFMSNDAKIRKQQEELQRQLNADPDLKKKVMALSAEGVLNIQDMKDINQLTEEVDKLLEEKNPTTIKGKLAKLKKEWDDPHGKFMKRVSAATAVVGLGAACYKLYSDVKKGKENTIKHIKSKQSTLQDMAKMMDEHDMNMRKDGKSWSESKYGAGTVNWLESKLAAIKFEQGCYNEAMNILNHNSSECSKGFGIMLKYGGNKKAKEVDASKSPIQRAIKNGKLLTNKNDKND